MRKLIKDPKAVVDTLPDVLSDLMLLACKDMKRCMKQDKKYQINMNVYYSPKGEFFPNKCQVCYAGSIMAKTIPIDFSIEFLDLPKSLIAKLGVLDILRRGSISAAMDKWTFITNNPKEEATARQKKELERKYCASSSQEGIYALSMNDHEQFLIQMKQMAKDLKKLGY